jgi:MFS family permease
MRPPPLPGFLAEVVNDKPAFRTLVAAALALAAAGLDPRVLSPVLPGVQAALRARPDLDAAAALLGVIGAAMLLIGGVAGDGLRTKRLLLGGLVVLALTAAFSLFVTEGPLFLASRFAGAAAASFVFPFAIAVVATAYQGVPRATAIGFAYAAYGAALAAPPILLTLTGPGGTKAPAYLAAAAAATVAAFYARRHIPDLPGTSQVQLAAVARIALWAFGVIAITAGLAAVGAERSPIRLATIGLGVITLLAAFFLDRRARGHAVSLDIDRRAVAVVLAAGVFIGLAQAVPLTLLPVFFQVALGVGPLLAAAALAPFMVALVVAGPIAGWLLPRWSPRALIGGGLVAIGMGDLAVALVAGLGANYLLFILPFVLLGTGFVIATTVRTAVIFASVPRGLPASAAALNEASISLGTKIGIIVGAVVLTEVTLATYAAGLPVGADTEAALAPLRDLLVALGTPSFSALVEAVDAKAAGPYAAAYVEGIRVVHLVAGSLAVVAGAVTVLVMGRRDPLRTIWELRDEREAPPAP